MLQIVIPHVDLPKLSNQALLEISLALFLTFALAEIIGAIASTSLSLLGDAICMSVDVTTYAGNAYVEWLKGRYGHVSPSMRWVVEVYAPSLSVLALLAVTAYITYDATRVLDHPPLRDTVDVVYLYGFSVSNLLVDLTCSLLFYLRREDVFDEQAEPPQLSLHTSLDEEEELEFGHLEEEEEVFAPHRLPLPADASLSKTCRPSYHPLATSSCPAQKRNLNMLSAFAHIAGDTLRTLSMLLAALVSSFTGLAGDVCDAWAAVLVCLSILAICLPVIGEIRKTASALYSESRSAPAEGRIGREKGGKGGDKRRLNSVEMVSYNKLSSHDFDDSEAQ